MPSESRCKMALHPLLVLVLALVFMASAVGLNTSPPPVPIVAASSGPIYWGAYINGGVDDLTLIDAFEDRAGKRLSLFMFGQSWKRNGSYQAFPAIYLQRIRDRGTVPMLDWFTSELGKGVEQPDFQLQDIYNGNHDAYITTWARASRDWGKPYFLRMNAEMNGWWHPFSEQTNGNSSGDFVKAWRHVVDIFEREGATNVTWIWCPNVQGPSSTPLPGLYPGDSYVDWVCMDGYNYGTDHGNNWHPFANIFKASVYNGYIDTYELLGQVAPTKPIMIGETASSEDGGSKADWITDMLVTQLPVHFPRVQAFLWFNWNDNDPEKDWPIESSPASQAAFKAGIASSYYAVNQFGTITSSPIQPPGGPLPAVPTYTPTPVPTATPVPKAYRDEILADGPVAYWRLGETSGTVAADRTAQRPGAYVGSPTLGVSGALQGDADPAVIVNGASQYVSVPHAAALSPQAGAGGKITLEAWVKLQSLPAGTPAMVIAKGDSGAYEYGLRIQPNGAVELILWTPNGLTYQAVASPGGAVSAGTWHHLVGTCENGVACRIYVDGTQRSSVTNGWGGTVPGSTTASVTLGRRGDGVQPLVGAIDEVVIYAHALDAGRVQMHYVARQTSGAPMMPTPDAPPAPPTATPIPPTCSPRPPVEVTTRAGGGVLSVTLRATGANNTIREVRFPATPNARVEINGAMRTGAFTIAVGSSSQPVTFQVHRVQAGQAVTVPITVVDGCGTWQTFVGGGPGAF